MWNVPTKERLDKIPRLYETEEIDLKEKQIFLHFFIFGSDWFICEYDGKDTFFGFCILNSDFDMAEWGYVSFTELKKINVNGIEVDCEKEEFWQIRPAKEIEVICTAQRWPINKKHQPAICGGEK